MGTPFPIPPSGTAAPNSRIGQKVAARGRGEKHRKHGKSEPNQAFLRIPTFKLPSQITRNSALA